MADKPPTDAISSPLLPPGVPLDPAAMIQYQTGAIVSRALVQKPAATITLFAFDQGQRLSEHTSPYDALIWVLDGVGEIELAGKPAQVATGQMIRLPADVPHAVHARERFKMLLVMVRS